MVRLCLQLTKFLERRVTVCTLTVAQWYSIFAFPNGSGFASSVTDCVRKLELSTREVYLKAIVSAAVCLQPFYKRTTLKHSLKLIVFLWNYTVKLSCDGSLLFCFVCLSAFLLCGFCCCMFCLLPLSVWNAQKALNMYQHHYLPFRHRERETERGRERTGLRSSVSGL